MCFWKGKSSVAATETASEMQIHSHGHLLGGSRFMTPKLRGETSTLRVLPEHGISGKKGKKGGGDKSQGGEEPASGHNFLFDHLLYDPGEVMAASTTQSAKRSD